MLPWLCILSLLLIFHSAYTDGIYNLTIANYNQQHQVLDISFADSSSSDPHQVYGVYMIKSSCPKKRCGFCIQHLLGSYQGTSMINSWVTLENVNYSCSYNLMEFTIQRCPSSKCELDFNENASCVSEYFNDSACTGMQDEFVKNDVSIVRAKNFYITLNLPLTGLPGIYYNISLVESCYPLKLKHITKIKIFSYNELISVQPKISMRSYCSKRYDKMLIVTCSSEYDCQLPVETCSSSLSFNYDAVCPNTTKSEFFDATDYSGVLEFVIPFSLIGLGFWLLCSPFFLANLCNIFYDKWKLKKNTVSPHTLQGNGSASVLSTTTLNSRNVSKFQSTVQFSTPFFGNHAGAAPPSQYKDILRMNTISAYSPSDVCSSDLSHYYKTEYANALTFS